MLRDRRAWSAWAMISVEALFRAGAALDPDPLTADPEVLPDARLRGRNSPMWLVRQARTPASGCSRPSPLSTGTARRSSWRRSSGPWRAAGSASGPLIRPADGDNFQNWRGMYPDVLGWLSTELSPPAAGR
ncbi:hypothetical protein [Streptomyces sp. NPDC002676]